MTVRVHGDSCWASGVAHNRAEKNEFPSGGAIWCLYVSFVACIYCGMVMACVLIGSSPGFCGVVVDKHKVGAESRFGLAFRQAL